MKFKVSEQIEAPIDFVFAEASDFARAERAAIRRGAKVRRVDTLVTTGPGMKWEASIAVRGRARDLSVELAEIAPPRGYRFDIVMTVFAADSIVNFASLGPERTQMDVEFELRPLNLRGRLLIQSLRLARGRIRGRMEKGLKAYARSLEQAYRASA